MKTQVRIQRPKKEKVTGEEALKQLKSFPKRRDKFMASIRKGAS